MSSQIKVTISCDGKATIETSGFTGTSCLDATREIEKALGRDAQRKYTSEYYVQETELHNPVNTTP